jgi:hypothetical protein
MPSPSDRKQSPIRLQCLNGDAAPAPIIDGWKMFLRFPNSGKRGFWNLLTPALMEPNAPSNPELLKRFCQEHKLSGDDVVNALQSCIFLLHQASSINLNEDLFRQDLVNLSGDDTEAPRIIISRYENTKAVFRNAFAEGTLVDHGKVLVGLDWRIDNVTASDRGAQLNASVIFLTLRYREGDRTDRFTLQLTPQTLKELKIFIDRYHG